jgi:high-affinity Fe2+/Pb2+ permease
MRWLVHVLKMTFASAAVGVLFIVGAIVVSLVIDGHGTPNHLSGSQLVMAFAVGFVVGVPIAWFGMSRPKREQEV